MAPGRLSENHKRDLVYPWKGVGYLQSRNENIPTTNPLWMLLMQNSIFVLPGPGSACEMAKSS